MRIRPHSLTARLTLYFALASTAVLLGAGSLIGARVQAHFVEQDLAEMKGKLELVRHMVARLQTADELEAVPRQLADALVGHEHLALTVQLAPQRSIFRTPGATLPAALAAWPPPADGPPIEWTQDGRHYRGLAGTAPTAIPGQAPLAVAIALDTRHHREFAAAFRASLAIALVCGIALSALLGWVAARRGLAPLHRLAQAVRGISAGRLEERLPGAAMPAELAELGLAFNQMLARLQESFERLSHFSDDLAHELRTPIGNLLLQTQVAASKARTADEYREVLYSSLEELERLARMVGDMLFIAQADNGLVVPSRVPIDLAAELQALFGFYEALADEQGVALELTGKGVIDGDRLMVRRALGNLLANAIAHSPRGAKVRVLLAGSAGGGCKLTMINPGSIASDHLARMFDRFYRIDATRHAGAGGAGLGLAITRSIVEAHGGTIRAESADGEVRITIDWAATPCLDAAVPGRGDLGVVSVQKARGGSP